MPQLAPFHFVNQITFVFLCLGFLLFLFSIYILPKFVALYETRIYVTML